MLLCIQHYIAAGYALYLFNLARPSAYGPKAGEQFSRIKGLCKVIVRPGVKARNPVPYLVEGGKHQHRHMAALAPYDLEQREAVELRQHPVQYACVVIPPAKQLQSLRPAMAAVRLEAPFFEGGQQHLAELNVVFYKQNTHSLSPVYPFHSIIIIYHPF